MGEALSIGDPAIELQLRRNHRARRMVLRVARTGQGPTLTLPPGVPVRAAVAFLEDQEGWLRRHLDLGPVRIRIGPDSVLPLGDRQITVRAAAAGRLRLEHDVLQVPGPAEEIGVRVGAFLREQARAACATGVARHAARLGRQPGRITLRDPRSRWGSCTSSGDLMFSWRLILAPSAVLDYVIAHEVAHLSELNHSPRFWAVVRGLCPDYAAPRDWLRRNGAELHAYDFAYRSGG
jgi:predicted metal-dependent hydrolase